ncbi:hypothetical protein, partial [Xenorhabdus bovienii]|uniref:hypothetical protein n=1 Tax=Xenorhabdus bovienii TaxID=40576 RepID=UPI0023B24844
TNNIFSVAGESIGSPYKALLIGPARVFYHEYHEVRCHLVDIDLDVPVADIASLLIDESNIDTDGNLVTYRQRHRWEEAYQQLPLSSEE